MFNHITNDTINRCLLFISKRDDFWSSKLFYLDYFLLIKEKMLTPMFFTETHRAAEEQQSFPPTVSEYQH